MSVYPIRVRKKSGRAAWSSGGKDYHLVLIRLNDKRSLFITRFGKRGTWGVGFHVERFDTLQQGFSAYNKKHQEKIERAYDEIIIDSDQSCATEREFRKALGEQYWNKIGRANLNWISLDIDATGVREEKTKEFEEVGGRIRLKEELKRLIPDKVETPEDRALATPIWGMF